MVATLVERVRTPLRLPPGPDADEAAQLDDRLDVVLDAQVADAVDAFTRIAARADALDDDGRGLLPALVAAGCLPGLERSDKTLDQRAHRLFVGPRHLVDDGRPGEDVALHREARADAVTRPVEAFARR